MAPAGGGGRWRPPAAAADGATDSPCAGGRTARRAAARRRAVVRGPAARLGRGDQRLDGAMLLIARCLTGAEVADQHTVLGGPHRGLQGGELPPPYSRRQRDRFTRRQ